MMQSVVSEDNVVFATNVFLDIISFFLHSFFAVSLLSDAIVLSLSNTCPILTCNHYVPVPATSAPHSIGASRLSAASVGRVDGMLNI